jgi:hypothetical protein
MYQTPRKKWRWEKWQGWFLYYAKLTIIIPEEPTLPDLEMDFTKHEGLTGASMGYTVSAFTAKGLGRKMRKAEIDAGVAE